MEGAIKMEERIQCPKCSSISYKIEDRGVHKTAFCDKCGAYIKNIPQGLPQKLYFGKYKDREVSSMTSIDEVKYLKWLIQNTEIKSNSLREAILKQIK